MTRMKDVSKEVLNSLKDELGNPDGAFVGLVKNAVDVAQQDNLARIEALEKEVNNLSESESVFNTETPLNTGPVGDDEGVSGFY